MAAGASAAGGSLESVLDRKFQSVSNTMDSIQGLSSWCIENKKYHSLIVRYWIKCLRKSDAAHRLNLFYLANDVIQNCKRKNAIVYRTAFAEVLPDAFLVVNYEGDAKVIKSVERILSIWEDRGVYSGTLITELRTSLVKEESPPETPVEQKTPVDAKADLRSKVVAEFVPQALIDQLSKYKRSLEEVDLREKQLAAMRIDVCSSETLKKLKDKAGGKKFSKDFEEGSAQLQEFVKFLDRESKSMSPVLEALTNADIFYETQYKEVKIVANAYQTFANRVTHLKRKLDNLKATVPDLDESPIPSPSADAPSPTGSESPFRGLEMSLPDPDIDGAAMEDDAEPPAPSPLSSPEGSPAPATALGEDDNREVEDMDLSEEEVESCGIIVEEKTECSAPKEVSKPAPAKKVAQVATKLPVVQATPPSAAPAAPPANVDLSKIGTILNNLSSVIKNTESPSAPPPTEPPVKTTPPAPVTSVDATSLVNLLSKVDMTPTELLSTLSKVQGPGSSLEGISSLLSNPAAKVTPVSTTAVKIPPSQSSIATSAAPLKSQPLSSVEPVSTPPTPTVKKSTHSQAPLQTSNSATALVQALHKDMELAADAKPSVSSGSLESKIHSFLQGNPGFSAFNLGLPVNPSTAGENLSPATGTDNQDGTPVRDEGGGTPTQDEIMDKPMVVPFTPNTHQSVETVRTGPIAYQNNPQQQGYIQPDVAQNGQAFQPYSYGKQEMSEHGTATPVAQYQQVSGQRGGLMSGEAAPGSGSSIKTTEGFRGVNEGGWYGDSYPEGNIQHARGYNVDMPGGAGENRIPGFHPYQSEQSQEHQKMSSQPMATTSSEFFRSMLPPMPTLPPPPNSCEGHPSNSSNTMIPPKQHPVPSVGTEDVAGGRVNSIISGMVIHDHQHKPMFDPLCNREGPRHHPGDIHSHPNELRYHEGQYRDDSRPADPPFFHEDPYHRPEDPYHRPGSPPHHYPRVRGRLTPPMSPSENVYYSHDFQPGSPPSPHFAQWRPPPPHPEHRLPGLRPPGPRPPGLGPPYRPPHRPPHPPPHLHPRGPPHAPPFHQFRGPGPRLQGKRPGPRGGGNVGPIFPPKRPFPPPRY
ncbi:regulation of nuclear pre-mRNA domain-containing protein 2a isoform X2 [Genypterus blacodes]|uniref:regulation of nuclear pre-mRNA domain-containing protein 2a isoform X2 n=1 Tax=Genypterus blacodes TaxID=154954 RepID=UPI003F76D253